MEYLLLFGGFVTLLLSGHFLVQGGVSLARHFKISTLVVGLTVVSLGTSAPELVVSLRAALSGHADVSLGTVIGSNISNIGLVLGLTVVLVPIAVNHKTIRFDWPVMMLSSIVFWIFIQNGWLNQWQGGLMVILLIAYVYYQIVKSRRETKYVTENIPDPEYSILITMAIILISSIGLNFGSKWLVEGASEIARKFGVSEYVISATLLAFGTSVPELATSVIAAMKKEMDISLGNILGSNLFNIFGILGVTSLIKKVEVNEVIRNFDIYYLFGISIALFAFMAVITKRKITRVEGFVLLFIYFAFIFIKFY